MTFDPSSIGLLAVTLALVGAFGGVLAGLLGVGGGIIVVPALFQLFHMLGIDADVGMKVAVGTSLATIIPTSISSLRAHHRRGAVDFTILKSWSVAIACGVLIGTLIAASVKGVVLTAVFATMALLIACYLAFVPETVRLSDHVPAGWRKNLIATLIGAISTMMGIGGGTLTVPVLALSSYPIRRAVGTASAIGLIIALPGTIGFMTSGFGVAGLPPFSLGYVNLLGFALIAPTTYLTAPLGAKIAHSIPPRALRLTFAGFLLLMSVRFYMRLLG